MSMRTHKFTTYLQPEEAYTLIELLDQMRESLMQAYGDDIKALLQQASASQEPDTPFDDDAPF
jgi:hypothetical protein